MLTELVTEAIVAERKRKIEERLQRQAVLDYLRQDGAAAPGALRLSAHWLGVRLERLGTSLQLAADDGAGELEVAPIVVRRIAGG